MGEYRIEGNRPIYVEITPVFGDITPSHADLTEHIDRVRQQVIADGHHILDIKADISCGPVVIQGTIEQPTAAIRVQAHYQPGNLPAWMRDPGEGPPPR